MTEKLAYPVNEASKLLGISQRSLRYLLSSGRLGFSRLGRRIVVPHRELEKLLRRSIVKATQTLDADAPIRPRNGNTPEASTPEVSDGPC